MCQKEGFRWACGCTYEWWNVCGDVDPFEIHCPGASLATTYTESKACCSSECCQQRIFTGARKMIENGRKFFPVPRSGVPGVIRSVISRHTTRCFDQFALCQGLTNDMRLRQSRPLYWPKRLEFPHPEPIDFDQKSERALQDWERSIGVKADRSICEWLDANIEFDDRTQYEYDPHDVQSILDWMRSGSAGPRKIMEDYDANFKGDVQALQATEEHLIRDRPWVRPDDLAWWEARSRCLAADKRETELKKLKGMLWVEVQREQPRAHGEMNVEPEATPSHGGYLPPFGRAPRIPYRPDLRANGPTPNYFPMTREDSPTPHERNVPVPEGFAGTSRGTWRNTWLARPLEIKLDDERERKNAGKGRSKGKERAV